MRKELLLQNFFTVCVCRGGILLSIHCSPIQSDKKCPPTKKGKERCRVSYTPSPVDGHWSVTLTRALSMVEGHTIVQWMIIGQSHQPSQWWRVSHTSPLIKINFSSELKKMPNFKSVVKAQVLSQDIAKV